MSKLTNLEERNIKKIIKYDISFFADHLDNLNKELMDNINEQKRITFRITEMKKHLDSLEQRLQSLLDDK